MNTSEMASFLRQYDNKLCLSTSITNRNAMYGLNKPYFCLSRLIFESNTEKEPVPVITDTYLSKIDGCRGFVHDEIFRLYRLDKNLNNYLYYGDVVLLTMKTSCTRHATDKIPYTIELIRDFEKSVGFQPMEGINIEVNNRNNVYWVFILDKRWVHSIHTISFFMLIWRAVMLSKETINDFVCEATTLEDFLARLKEAQKATTFPHGDIHGLPIDTEGKFPYCIRYLFEHTDETNKLLRESAYNHRTSIKYWHSVGISEIVSRYRNGKLDVTLAEGIYRIISILTNNIIDSEQNEKETQHGNATPIHAAA